MGVIDAYRSCSGICLTLGALAALGSMIWAFRNAETAQKERQVVEHRLAGLKADGRDGDPRLLEEYRLRLSRLEAMNIIGDESRLVFIENVHDAGRNSSLSDLRYELQPRVPLSSVLPLSSSSEANASAMRVVMRLKHPEELGTFLDRLRNRGRGLFWTRHCELESRGQDMGFDAQCELLWITVKPEAVQKERRT